MPYIGKPPRGVASEMSLPPTAHHKGFDRALDAALRRLDYGALADAKAAGEEVVTFDVTLQVDVTTNPGQIGDYRIILEPR